MQVIVSTDDAPEEPSPRRRGRPRKSEAAPPPEPADSAGPQRTRKRTRQPKEEEPDKDEFVPLKGPSDAPASKRRRSVNSANGGNHSTASNAGEGSVSEGGQSAGRELLTEDQKRQNHIESEKKRRQNIRVGFEQLVDMVPELKAGLGKGLTIKSEALILQKSHEYIESLKKTRREVQGRILEFREALGEEDETPLFDDSEDEEVDERGRPKQTPARLAQIQQLAKQALRGDTLPTADLVFQLAAEGRLSSTTPKTEDAG
ncbi:hypothetical protein DFJ74DRAFT_17571 [Hyaloraphidium curvatum]|nr:hypothetical protein DFJ74DRAFT_17571 [Hyaloraphidium curvatum]